MISFSDEYKDDFLTPKEDNINLLFQKIKQIHSHVETKFKVNDPRVAIDPSFSYNDEISNSEIPLEGKSSDEVLKGASEAFEGIIRFHSPTALFNITPPPLLDTVAVSALTNLYNPNLLWDYSAGKFILFEKKVVKYLCDLSGFDYKVADGYSCFGGKGAFLYAIKEGLNKTNRSIVNNGIKDEYVVVAGKVCHYAIESACNYLGIGKGAARRVDCDENEDLKLDKLEETIRASIAEGKKIACIISSGGGTLDMNVDRIQDVCNLRDKIVEEYKLHYKPHVHVDSVIGWVWLFFKYYDFEKNELNIDAISLPKIKQMYSRIKDIHYADSFSADFHKTGLCPYNSSFYISKSGEELQSIGKDKKASLKEVKFGDYQVYQSTLENSRSGVGVLSSWVAINRMGIIGFQKYISYLVSTSTYIKNRLNDKYKDEFEILNDFSPGYCIMIKPNFNENSMSFKQLLTADVKQQEIYNEYCFDFYKYLSFELASRNETYPLLGFTPKYRERTLNSNIAAFKIFPSSIHMTEEVCNALVELIVSTKSKFESERDHNRNYSKYTSHDHQPS
jgi:glutamate/tyrosine decarboxylase-like PLP-dependent enzyme